MPEVVGVVPPRVAFGDESFSEHATSGFYVLAAVVLAPDRCDDVREAMLELRRRLRGRRAGDKLHWNHLDSRQQQDAVKQVTALPGLYVGTIGSPVPPRRQERARAVCLGRLVVELYRLGVTQLLMEAREQDLNKRDVRTVTGTRYLLPRGSEFRIDHEFGLRDPALWAADLIAGAARAHQLGDSTYWQMLADRVLEIEVVTEC